MSRYILDTFKGVDTVVDSDNSFFFYNPDPNIPPDHMFPFVTLMTNDINDQFSNLNRPSVYRVNIGVGKQTFRSLFGGSSPRTEGDEKDDSGEKAESGDDDSKYDNYDFTALDQVMPHPVYGRMHWMCILNPSDETLEAKVRPLLDEAYDMAVSKYNKQAARR